MAHLRKQIRDNFVTALTSLSTTGSRVYASRVYPMAAANLPGLCVYAKSEEVGGSCRRINHLPIADPYWLGNQRVAAQIGFYKNHRKGAEAEATALAWLLRQGFFVFANFAGRGPVDLVAIEPEKPSVFLIDVKAVVRTGPTIHRPRLTKTQRRLGVRFLMVYLDQDTCKFEDPNHA